MKSRSQTCASIYKLPDNPQRNAGVERFNPPCATNGCPNTAGRASKKFYFLTRSGCGPTMRTARAVPRLVCPRRGDWLVLDRFSTLAPSDILGDYHELSRRRRVERKNKTQILFSWTCGPRQRCLLSLLQAKLVLTLNASYLCRSRARF